MDRAAAYEVGRETGCELDSGESKSGNATAGPSGTREGISATRGEGKEFLRTTQAEEVERTGEPESTWVRNARLARVFKRRFSTGGGAEGSREANWELELSSSTIL